MYLTTTHILAMPCEIHVSQSGVFSAYLGHPVFSEGTPPPPGAGPRPLATAATFMEVVERAKPIVRKRKARVEVRFYDNDLVEGIATGFHAGNGNVLVTLDGVPQQWDTYRVRVFSGDTPATVRSELRQLRDQIARRQETVRQLQEQWTIDLKAEVEKAIAVAEVAS